MFQAVEGAGVRWAILRGEDRLESPPHDVDLLVAAADLRSFGAAVRPLGFLAVPTWARGSHRFFVAYLAEFDRWMVLDVVTELSYGPGYAVRTRAAEACLERRERAGPLSLLSGDDAFWTLLFHCLLDKRHVRDHQRERLRALRPGASGDSALGRFAAGMCPPGWDAGRILATVASGEWDELVRLGHGMLRRWRRRHPGRYWARDLADRVGWRLAPLHAAVALRGLVVVVAADDTETARRLAARLPGRFYFPARLLDANAPPERSHAATRVLDRARAGYHAARGRVVVATDARTVRPDVVIELSRGDLADGHRNLIGLIWEAYGERRGWTVG